MDDKDYPVANLTEDSLKKVQHMENELRQEMKDDIVLIAYKKDQGQQNITANS